MAFRDRVSPMWGWWTVIHFRWGLPRSGGGVYEGKKEFVYLKWASHFWLYSQFHFSPEEKFLGL